MFPVFIDFRDIGVALFGIETPARSKKLSKHRGRVGSGWCSRLLGLFHGAAHDFGLRNLPAGGQDSESLSCRIVQGEGGAVRHCGHTITPKKRQGR